MKWQGRASRIGILTVMVVSLFCCYAYSGSVTEDAVKKGLEYSKQGDNDSAIEEFTKAIASDPSSANAYYGRAYAYYKNGKLKESVSDFDKVITLDPASADAYYNRALALYKMGSFDAAIADYNKVLEINPNAIDALYGRGLAYFKKNDIKQALSDYSKVIEMRPDFPLAYSARAIAYFSKKDYVRTLTDVNKAIALGFRLRPLKEVALEVATTLEPEKIESSQLADRASVKAQVWKAKRHAARVRMYLLTVALIICLITILILLIKSRKANIVLPPKL